MTERKTTTGEIRWDERATAVEHVDDPIAPDGEGWHLVASCTGELRYSKQTICWFWERDVNVQTVPLPINSNIPSACAYCKRPLHIGNLFVDDGCPCNSRRGINFEPLPCNFCKADCVKLGHHLEHHFGDVAAVLRTQVVMDCEELVWKYADSIAAKGEKEAAARIHEARRALRAFKGGR